MPGKRRLNSGSSPTQSSEEMKESRNHRHLNGTPSVIMPSVVSVDSVITLDSDEVSSQLSGRLGRSSSFIRQLAPLDDADLRTNAAIQELTLNKLRFDSVGLIGREEELEILKSLLRRMLLTTTSTTSSSEEEDDVKRFGVFIDGHSGVGRTALLASVKQEALDLCPTVTIGEGKFDITSSNVPYSAITTAFGNICDNISRQQQAKTTDDIGQILLEEVGEDIHLLAQLIPQLDLILPFEVQSVRKARIESFDVEAARTKFEHAFRVMTRVMSSCCGPLIVLLDDLQWADVSSLNVIDFLMSDTGNEHKFMIIGCFRSEEVNDISHVLTRRIEGLKEKQNRFKFHITNISLTNLDLDGVNHLIMALLSITDETRTQSLAEVCFKRSMGNPFFVIEFVSLLEEERLLSFNLGTLEWGWDSSVIDQRTMSTANVVDLVRSRMKKLPQSTQLLLQYAACLGQRIKFDILYYLWAKLDTPEEDLASLLAQLVKANFFEKVDNRTYRWVHDQVKETALMTGDAAEPAFQFEVGCTLYHALDNDDLEDLLFEVTDLINTAKVGRRLEFAQLNLRAGEKAKKISAFNSASKFVAKGIELLPTDAWENHKDLTLRLHIIGVQMELAVGRIEIMEKYSKAVLSQTSCTPVEKAPVYLAQCYELASVSLNSSASINLGLKVLRREFGMRFGGTKLLRPAIAIKSLLKTIKAVKRKDKEFFEKLGEMTDPSQLVIMDIISRISYSGYFAKDVFIQVLCTVKLVDLTMEHGTGALGGFPFISLGLLAMAVMKDNEAAAQFTQLGFMLHAKCKSETATSAAIFVANQLIYPWMRPIQLARPELEVGYTSGMRAGNSEMGLWCHLSNHIVIPYQTGKPLESILSKCSALAAQCEELKLALHEITVRLHWQLILDLMGASEKVAVLNGDSVNVEKWQESKVDQQFKEINEFVFLGEYEAAARVALDLGDSYDKTRTNMPQVMPVNFLRALAMYTMARHTRKGKYLRQAKRLRDKIGGWLKAGNPNVSHFYPLLCAEQAAIDKKKEDARRHYHDAIVLSARTGHIQYAALANERYADFCRNELGDEDEASFRIEEAIRYYKEWGAHAKVERLQRIYGDSRDNRTQATVGTS
ncbi:unnamed protein product [Cylindrotheca closterium]|uniref:Orc1-like AAA ATPase domain-containing protein n=1 Tax=Cylindrotheca closterium TaxID=2856 RepID=A0AAD2PVJ9_9STRA|nr:unnamed protein product [Cylindrotheca closterium]